MKIEYFLIILSFLFLGCSNKQVKKQENTNRIIAVKDTLQQNFQSIDLESEENSICFDTLKIVSGNCKVLYYPFGIYNNMEEFLGFLPKEVSVKKQIKMNGTETSYIKYKNNYIEVLVGDDYCEKNSFVVNIVSAEIKDETIEIMNCIKIGITKQSFIKKLKLDKIDNLNKINVIEIISVLDGIWQYYTFDANGTLKIIEIKSDYMFE